MKVTRIYNDARGESHFEDIDIALEDAGAIGRLSQPQPVASVVFRDSRWLRKVSNSVGAGRVVHLYLVFWRTASNEQSGEDRIT